MRKHLSVLALAARGTVCKVIAVTILAALLSGALLRLVPAYEDRVVYANDDGSVTSEYYPSDFSALPGKTGAAAVCAVGFAALLAVLSLNGCGYGAKTGLTVGRLRIGEDSLCLWWSLYNAVCVLFYWAVMAAVCVAVVKLRVDTVQMPYGSYTPGPQTLLLSVSAPPAAPAGRRRVVGKSAADGAVRRVRRPVLPRPAPGPVQHRPPYRAGADHRQLFLPDGLRHHHSAVPCHGGGTGHHHDAVSERRDGR